MFGHKNVMKICSNADFIGLCFRFFSSFAMNNSLLSLVRLGSLGMGLFLYVQSQNLRQLNNKKIHRQPQRIHRYSLPKLEPPGYLYSPLGSNRLNDMFLFNHYILNWSSVQDSCVFLTKYIDSFEYLVVEVYFQSRKVHIFEKIDTNRIFVEIYRPCAKLLYVNINPHWSKNYD